jgi:oxygen-dependent protoporphyrinogen oxidase
MKREVTVIGAGISGLSTAYYLTKAGVPVRVVEQQARAGGLLGTHRTPHGLVETAANGLLNSARLEAMCADINVTLQALQPQARARYFWRGGVRRWPLSLGESARLGAGLVRHLGHWRPRPGETLASWGETLLGPAAVRHALTPAMGGIYASEAGLLSASLIFNRQGLGLANRTPGKTVKPKVRGTVSPKGGMQELIEGLHAYLRQHGVAIEFNQAVEITPQTPTVICTAAPQAAALLREAAPAVSAQLQQIELLPIVTATCFYEPTPRQPRGFGCLFPRGGEIRALGALFNDCLFANRSALRSETWILGGATDRAVLNLSEAELETLLRHNHALLVGAEEPLLQATVTRWPQALPHYTLALERVLTTLAPLPPHLALVGNYLGQIGLAKIIERAALVAGQFAP